MNYQTSPAKLLDHLIAYLRLKNDAELARALDVKPPTISKARLQRLQISADLLLRMHEVSGLSLRDLRFLAGDTRPHTGPSAVPL